MQSTKPKQISIRKLIRETRHRVLMAARCIDAYPIVKQTELDVLEMLRLTFSVVTARLIKPSTMGYRDSATVELVNANHFEERKKDAKKNYPLLFDSIRLDTIETLRRHFMGVDGSKATGIVLQKYNTVVLDIMFEALKRAGCLLYTSPSPRDKRQSRMPSSA